MAGEYSFRVVAAPGQLPVVAEISGDVPPGVYQISGHDNSASDASPDNQISVSIVQHDPAGVAVVGASGYRDA